MEDTVQLEQQKEIEFPSVLNEKLQELKRDLKECQKRIISLESERLQLEEKRMNALLEFERLDDFRAIGDASQKEVDKAKAKLDDCNQELKRNSAFIRRSKDVVQQLEIAIEKETQQSENECRKWHMEYRSALLKQMLDVSRQLEKKKELFEASVIKERQDFQCSPNTESLPRLYSNFPFNLHTWISEKERELNQVRERLFACK